MTTTLEIINDAKKPSAIYTSSGKDLISPDFPGTRPKSTTSLGAGSVSRTDGSTTDFSVGACYRNSNNGESCENINNKHVTSIPGSSSRHNSESRDPLSSVVGNSLPGGGGGSGSFAPKKSGEEQRTPISSSPSKQTDGTETIIIEERRRKVGDDGYSTHRYMRGSLLGKGGFAKVYLCTAMETGKHYAMKIVPKANLVKERARQKVRP